MFIGVLLGAIRLLPSGEALRSTNGFLTVDFFEVESVNGGVGVALVFVARVVRDGGAGAADGVFARVVRVTGLAFDAMGICK